MHHANHTNEVAPPASDKTKENLVVRMQASQTSLTTIFHKKLLVHTHTYIDNHIVTIIKFHK